MELETNGNRQGSSACGAMKYDQTERECAKRLKPFRKTIKDATDFYIRHLSRKKSTGRPEHSGAYSGITRYMDWQQLRGRLLKLSHRAQFDVKVLDRFETEMWGTQAKQQRAAEQQLPRANIQLIEQRRAEQAALTLEQFAERICKRDGSANSAANALKQYLKQNPIPANLEGDEREREIKKQWRAAERLLLPRTAPAGRFTGAMASDIFNALEKRELSNGGLLVEGHAFASKEDAMDAIRDLATWVQFRLKKQPRRPRRVMQRSA